MEDVEVACACLILSEHTTTGRNKDTQKACLGEAMVTN